MAEDTLNDLEALVLAGRTRNAQVVSVVLCVLYALGVASILVFEENRLVLLSELVGALSCALSYFLTKRGRLELAMGLCMAATCIHFVAAVAALGRLSVVPAFACAPVLIAAATLRRAWLTSALAAGTLTLLAQATLTHEDLARTDSIGMLLGGASLVVFAFALSSLHLAAVERSLAAVREREAARDAALARQRALELQVREAQHVASLGRLARSVGHDFNNLLTIVGASASFAREELAPGHPALAELDQIEDAATRGGRLIAQLISFGRQGAVAAETIDPAKALRAMEPLLKSLVGAGVSVDISVCEPCPLVRMPLTELEQVLMNFAVNAKDAMKGTGHLEIRLRDPEASEVSHLPDGRYLCLAVADSGPGIAPAILPMIFDPFFTTKGDKGTGLGLSTCHAIATERGGSVRVRSAPGEGATFELLLPAQEPEAAPSAASSE